MTARKVKMALESLSPFSPARFIPNDPHDDPLDDEHWQANWREHAHTNDNGQVYIPANMMRHAIYTALIKCSGFKAKEADRIMLRIHIKDMLLSVMVEKPLTKADAKEVLIQHVTA